MTTPRPPRARTRTRRATSPAFAGLEDAQLAHEIADAAERSQLVTALQQVRQDVQTLAAKFDKLAETYVTRREIDQMIAAARPMTEQVLESIKQQREDVKDVAERVERLGERVERSLSGDVAYARYLNNQDRQQRERRVEDAAYSARDDLWRYQVGQERQANERSFTINLNTVGWIIGVASIVVTILIAAKVI